MSDATQQADSEQKRHLLCLLAAPPAPTVLVSITPWKLSLALFRDCHSQNPWSGGWGWGPGQARVIPREPDAERRRTQGALDSDRRGQGAEWGTQPPRGRAPCSLSAALPTPAQSLPYKHERYTGVTVLQTQDFPGFTEYPVAQADQTLGHPTLRVCWVKARLRSWTPWV